MNKFLKVLTGVLIGIAVCLMGCCGFIFLYAKFHTNPSTEKSTYNLAESSEESASAHPKEEVPIEANQKPSSTDSSEESSSMESTENKIQEDLSMEQVQKMLCEKYSLSENNLSYYDEADINGEPYYRFFLIDAGGGTWESLLVYNKNTNKEYFYDVLGNISEINNDSFANINENIATDSDTQETGNGSQEDIGVSHDNAEKEYCNGLKWGTQLKLVNKEYAPLDKSTWLLDTYFGTCDSLDGYKSDRNIDMTFYFNNNDELIKIEACIVDNEIDNAILYFVEYYNKIHEQNYTQVAGDTRYRWFGKKTNVSMYSTSDGVLYITYEPAISE